MVFTRDLLQVFPMVVMLHMGIFVKAVALTVLRQPVRPASATPRVLRLLGQLGRREGESVAGQVIVLRRQVCQRQQLVATAVDAHRTGGM